MPPASVARRRCAPVPSFVTITETFGITAALESVTRPTILPLNDCPHAAMAASERIAPRIALVNLFMNISPIGLKERCYRQAPDRAAFCIGHSVSGFCAGHSVCRLVRGIHLEDEPARS